MKFSYKFNIVTHVCIIARSAIIQIDLPSHSLQSQINTYIFSKFIHLLTDQNGSLEQLAGSWRCNIIIKNPGDKWDLWGSRATTGLLPSPTQLIDVGHMGQCWQKCKRCTATYIAPLAKFLRERWSSLSRIT